MDKITILKIHHNCTIGRHQQAQVGIFIGRELLGQCAATSAALSSRCQQKELPMFPLEIRGSQHNTLQ